jgi:Fur family ferric uptake transcriptional regulator
VDDPTTTSRLRELGQRVTPARQAVLEIVGSTDDHLSAEQIATLVAAREPDVHRATIFRTLDRLVSLGVLAHVHVPHAPTTYHLRRDDERMHIHVVCRECGGVFDADPALLDTAADELAETSGFVLEAEHTALSGRCASCAAP